MLGSARIILIFLCYSLTACGTPQEHPFLPRTDVPEIRAGKLYSGDQSALPIRMWLPENEPRAAIIALHGFNDYSRAFEGAGEYFMRRGIAMYAYDQRGFGANQNRHGIWDGKENLIEDLRDAIVAVHAKHPDTPIYVLGESMGGAVTIATLVHKLPVKIDGLILSAPAVWGDETMHGLYRITLWVMAHTAPAYKLTGKGLDIVATDNFDILREMGRDPYVIKGSRVDSIYGIVHLMDSAYEDITKLELPVLFLYGAKDQIIPLEPVARALKRLKAPYTMAYYPNGYHMLLRDLKGEVVLKDIVSWMEDRYKPLPSGYDMGWQTHIEGL